jgi:GNAT superfamily N-acetyltransferase
MTSGSNQNHLPVIPDINIHHDFQYGDLGKVLYLHGQIYHQEYNFNHEFEVYVAEGLAEFARKYKPGRSCIWLAETKEQVIGSIAILERENKQAQLRWFLVHPDFQGLKLGKYLFQRAIDFCRNAEYERIVLWTLENLFAAKAIYEAKGFQPEEKKKHYLWGQELTEVYYVLNLKE